MIFFLSCFAEQSLEELEKEKEDRSSIHHLNDIVLITIDTLRADRVGAYGDQLAHTPNMDLLAEQGALFRDAYAVTPLTLPSHASILTGLLPKNHQLLFPENPHQIF